MNVGFNEGKQFYFTYTHSLQQDVQKCWEIEECSKDSHLNKNENDIYEEHFINNHWRTAEGRFLVRIPLKGSIQEISNTKPLAEKRLLAMERKFEKSREFSDLLC